MKNHIESELAQHDLQLEELAALSDDPLRQALRDAQDAQNAKPQNDEDDSLSVEFDERPTGDNNKIENEDDSWWQSHVTRRLVAGGVGTFLVTVALAVIAGVCFEQYCARTSMNASGKNSLSESVDALSGGKMRITVTTTTTQGSGNGWLVQQLIGDW